MRWLIANHRLVLTAKEISLTPIEERIVALLLSRNGELVGRDEIIEAMYRDDPDGGPDDAESNLRVRMHLLREKLNQVGLDGMAVLPNDPRWGYAMPVPK